MAMHQRARRAPIALMPTSKSPRLLWTIVVATIVLATAALLLRRRHEVPDRAISAAVSYFASRPDSVDASALTFLSALAWRRRVDALDLVVRTQRDRACRVLTERRLGTFCRLLDSQNTPPVENLDASIDRLTSRALQCDRTELPETYLDDLKRAENEGGYALTHAAIALHWARANGCIDRRVYAEHVESQTVELVRIAEEAPVSDLGMEAIAALYLIGEGDRVQPAWVRNVIAGQNADGGWGVRTGRASTDHPSVLGLWVLLEASAPFWQTSRAFLPR
jgi:hypothetical protein